MRIVVRDRNIAHGGTILDAFLPEGSVAQTVDIPPGYGPFLVIELHPDAVIKAHAGELTCSATYGEPGNGELDCARPYAHEGPHYADVEWPSYPDERRPLD